MSEKKYFVQIDGAKVATGMEVSTALLLVKALVQAISDNMVNGTIVSIGEMEKVEQVPSCFTCAHDLGSDGECRRCINHSNYRRRSNG